MKSFKDILSEKPKKEKKFSIDQINAVLAKVGIKPSMVVAAINALNAARGLGIVEAKSDVDKIHQADMNRFLRNAIDEYNKLMTSMVAINVRDSDILQSMSGIVTSKGNGKRLIKHSIRSWKLPTKRITSYHENLPGIIGSK
jgi:hypothetical protein